MVNKKQEEIIFSMMWHIGVGDFSMHCAKNIFYSYLLNVNCFLISLSLFLTRLIESVFPPASSFTFPIHPIAMLQCFNQHC